MISALTADRLGFDALYMTGYGVVASHLGLPDAGLASYTEMVGRVSTIAGGIKAPLIADGDTGFGGLLNVDRTVRGYEQAGAVAIQLEDQKLPKKCGHTLGRDVIELDDMVKKIRVAKEARSSEDFLIIARTDARTAYGFDEAMRRVDAFAEAGADILFLESPETEEEMAKFCAAFELPCLANMVEGGRTPVLSREQLIEIGYQMAIYPATGFLAATAALESVYSTLKQDGTSLKATAPIYDFEKMTKLMGFERIWEFDNKYLD